jgi:hypothetical protein
VTAFYRKRCCGIAALCNNVTEDFVRLVYSYDLLFFVGKTRPATFSVIPQPG